MKKIAVNLDVANSNMKKIAVNLDVANNNLIVGTTDEDRNEQVMLIPISSIYYLTFGRYLYLDRPELVVVMLDGNTMEFGVDRITETFADYVGIDRLWEE